MTTNQIYSLVNAVNSQAFGQSALTVADTSGLISLGNTVLSSSSNTEAFLNTLAQRIGRSILRFRDFRSGLAAGMTLNDFEYGAILQKIKVQMPQAESDEMYSLTDGTSVDHYKVSKPAVDQKLFVTRTPYQFKITVQRETLREAFLSPEAMGSFVGVVFGEVRNAIELSLDNLARITLATAIAETSGTAGRVINLVTDYNTEATPATPLTAQTALHDPAFLAYAVARMNSVRDSMTDMSTQFNDGTFPTFTPVEDMRVRIISSFNRRLQTVVQYAAFHDELVKYDGTFQSINFWQAQRTPMNVDIKRPSDGTEVSVDNVVAMIADRDAMGIYKIDEEVLTTPVNAAGSYYNTYWHEKQLWFIDKSENFVIFTLN